MKNFKEYVSRVKELMNINCKNCENINFVGDKGICVCKGKVINNYLEATKCDDYRSK